MKHQPPGLCEGLVFSESKLKVGGSWTGDFLTTVGSQYDVPREVEDSFRRERLVPLLGCPKGKGLPAAPVSTLSFALPMSFFLGQVTSSVVKTSLRTHM